MIKVVGFPVASGQFLKDTPPGMGPYPGPVCPVGFLISYVHCSSLTVSLLPAAGQWCMEFPSSGFRPAISNTLVPSYYNRRDFFSRIQA